MLLGNQAIEVIYFIPLLSNVKVSQITVLAYSHENSYWSNRLLNHSYLSLRYILISLDSWPSTLERIAYLIIFSFCITSPVHIGFCISSLAIILLISSLEILALLQFTIVSCHWSMLWWIFICHKHVEIYLIMIDWFLTEYST